MKKIKLPVGLKYGLGLGLIGWSILSIPFTINGYASIKENWILIIGCVSGIIAVILGFCILIFTEDKESITKEKEPPRVTKKNKHYRPRKNKRPFISEKEWEELEEEDDEMFIIEEMLDD